MARKFLLNEILDTRKACHMRNAFPDVKLYLEHVDALLVASGQEISDPAGEIVEPVLEGVAEGEQMQEDEDTDPSDPAEE